MAGAHSEDRAQRAAARQGLRLSRVIADLAITIGDEAVAKAIAEGVAAGGTVLATKAVAEILERTSAASAGILAVAARAEDMQAALAVDPGVDTGHEGSSSAEDAPAAEAG